jgi:hypothetical protein
MIVANGKAAGDILADGAQVPSYALAQRLKGFKTGPASGGMNADALGVVVIDRNEDRNLAFRGPEAYPFLQLWRQPSSFCQRRFPTHIRWRPSMEIALEMSRVPTILAAD